LEQYINLFILQSIQMARKNIIGNRIKLARKKAIPPINQENLAARLQLKGLQIGRATISKIETGHCRITDIEIAAIAEVLGVTVSWLFDQDS
jgi:transcriptional regulator with XRE-family HTH domain